MDAEALRLWLEWHVGTLHCLEINEVYISSIFGKESFEDVFAGLVGGKVEKVVLGRMTGGL